MKPSTHLHFNHHIGRQKPESIRNRSTKCPFCNRDALEDVLAEDGPILLVKNKYPVLIDTFQTVLIETDDCDSELSLYPKEHLYRLIRFGMNKWLEMEQSGEFTSVLFYKNHGPYSGGTIRHPHMQIVGLNRVDYSTNMRDEHFQGLCIAREKQVEFNLSTHPRAGFFEFNVILDDLDGICRMADFIQIAAHYTLNVFSKSNDSYNLFFYRWKGKYVCKIVPRYVTSPLYVGFSIPQVSTSLQEVITAVKENYL